MSAQQPSQPSTQHTQHPKPLSTDKDHRDKMDDKPDVKILPVESSLDWLDSGVDPDSGKSIYSLDEKKVSITIKDAELPVKSDVKNSVKEGKNERKASRSSDTSENHSEADVKVEISSEGVKSDEGFSETSEEIAIKGQQLSPVKSKCDSHVLKSSSG